MQDAEALFLDTLYQGVTDGAALKRALELAQQMFNCLGGALVSFDAHAPATDIAMTSGIFEEHGAGTDGIELLPFIEPGACLLRLGPSPDH